jgi:FkbM family methyltransferase
MLIPFNTLAQQFAFDRSKYILHIGADECQEKNMYNTVGFTDDNIIWIEGNSETVNRMKLQYNDKLKIFDALISDVDGDERDFIITNNNQSSSILELDIHLKEHPQVFEVRRYKKNTITVETLLKQNNIDISNIEFVNIDIQGAELMALKGMKNILKHAKYLYLEVNEKHLYKNCPLIGELESFLKEFNFERKMIDMTCHGWGDAFYVKNT